MNESLKEITMGAICFCFGLALFVFISNQTRKNNKSANIYDFNVYVASIILMLVGLYLFCVGIIRF